MDAFKIRLIYGSPERSTPKGVLFFVLVTRTRNLTRRIAQSAYALGSQHCSAVSYGDLVRRSKFPDMAPPTWCFFFSCGLVTRARNLTRLEALKNARKTRRKTIDFVASYGIIYIEATVFILLNRTLERSLGEIALCCFTL